MPWNGSGTFNRIYSWVADKAAGLDISSSRMDTDTNDLAANGFGNCLTRDGQGQPSANLPMAGFRHTGVQNAVSRSDYAAFGQVQDALSNWTVAAGTADALTATFTPALTALSDGQLCFVRASAANATTTPTFAPNGLPARTITKQGGVALALGDIAGNLSESILRYNVANTRWELLNPANIVVNNSLATTGDGKITLKTAADTGWVLADDGTIGNAGSGASNRANADCQPLFNLLFASPFTDTSAPLFTSAGAGTTRAAQGSAAAAWAAGCRMSLTKQLGRSLAIAGAGSGLTSRTLGASNVGTETQSLSTANLPAYTPAGSIANGAITVAFNAANVTSASGGGNSVTTGNFSATGALNLNAATVGQGATTFTGTAQGGTATAFSIMDPKAYWNVMVKL